MLRTLAAPAESTPEDTWLRLDRLPLVLILQ